MNISQDLLQTRAMVRILTFSSVSCADSYWFLHWKSGDFMNWSAKCKLVGPDWYTALSQSTLKAEIIVL